MTNEQIEKSLKCCSKDCDDCSKCYVSKKLKDTCKCGQALIKETLEYIEVLKEEKTQAYANGQRDVLQEMYNVAKEGKGEVITIDCDDIVKTAKRYGVDIEK